MRTHTARGSENTSLWMCSIRSPPAEYSITKHTCSGVWKQPKRFTRKGCPALVTAAKIRFSHIRLGRRQKSEPSCPLPYTHALWGSQMSATGFIYLIWAAFVARNYPLSFGKWLRAQG